MQKSFVIILFACTYVHLPTIRSSVNQTIIYTVLLSVIIVIVWLTIKPGMQQEGADPPVIYKKTMLQFTLSVQSLLHENVYIKFITKSFIVAVLVGVVVVLYCLLVGGKEQNLMNTHHASGLDAPVIHQHYCWTTFTCRS